MNEWINKHKQSFTIKGDDWKSEPIEAIPVTALEELVAKGKKAWDKGVSWIGLGTDLGRQLNMVAKLIDGGLQTKVYHVQMSGFDTHAGQVNSVNSLSGLHSYLLKELADAVADFIEDIPPTYDVTVMTYSEFGREVKANGSFGTDHGHAAPLFIFGDNINQQVIGSTPDLSGDVIPHEHDFRQVYVSVLADQGFNPSEILLRDFAPLPIFKGDVVVPPAKEVYDIIQSQRAGLKYTLFTDNTWI